VKAQPKFNQNLELPASVMSLGDYNKHKPAWDIGKHIQPTTTQDTGKDIPETIKQDIGGDPAGIINAAKQFLWTLTQQEEVTHFGVQQQNEKEREVLGKKLADKIRDLSKKDNIYESYPGDTAIMLAIWAKYRSKKETSSYLLKTFEKNPYNAIKFLKCYLPTVHLSTDVVSVKDFDINKYNLISKVVDTVKVYETLARFFKFKAREFDDIVPVTFHDRDLANKFMRLHISSDNSF
jgi:hypothetical protein